MPLMDKRVHQALTLSAMAWLYLGCYGPNVEPLEAETHQQINAPEHVAQPLTPSTPNGSLFCSLPRDAHTVEEVSCPIRLKPRGATQEVVGLQLSVAWHPDLEFVGYRADVCNAPTQPCARRFVNTGDRVGTEQHQLATNPQTLSSAQDKLTLMLFSPKAPYPALPTQLGELVFRVKQSASAPTKADIRVDTVTATGSDAQPIAVQFRDGYIEPHTPSAAP